jgi:DNA-binding transcriptional LysR family regulator
MSSFTLKQLEIFITVARHMSISEAARMLHLSQPGVSHQIRKIEMHTGRRLFEQMGKKIYLTEEGSLLLEQAKNIIEQAELFNTACIANNPNISGKLKLSTGILLQPLFFNLYSKFSRQYPSVNVELLDGDQNIQLQYLHENKIDFCLMMRPTNRIKLVSEMIIDLPMTFIVSPQHRLANKRNFTLQMLSDETFIVCGDDSVNYIKIHELFKKLNNSSPKLIQIKDPNAIKQAVMANLGISVLPNYMLQLELKHSLITPLIIDDSIKPTTAAYWVQHADKKLSAITQIFKNFIFNEFGVTNLLPKEKAC